MTEVRESEAYRHWRNLVRFSRGEDASRQGIDYLQSRIAEGWLFRPDEVDLAAEVVGYGEFGLAASLRRFLPRLQELVAGNGSLALRMAELTERVHVIELELDGFAAGTRHFPDDTYLVQIDNGLLLTVFEVAQLFVDAAMPDPDAPVGRAEREAAVILEFMSAEYRLLRRHVTPKATLPTPAQGVAVGELTQAANLFVLVHELAHVLLGHGGKRADDQRQIDEIASDILAFRILAGSYSREHTIESAQAFGRLLGARLVFACIELFERSTFVTTTRTHPPAADRWEAVRSAAAHTFGQRIVDGVEELWQPMDRLLRSEPLPLAGVRSTLESIKADGRFIGDAADVGTAVSLIHVFRLTNTPVEDSVLRAEGAALAAAAQVETADRGSVSWRELFELQTCQEEQADRCAAAVAVAARILAGGGSGQ